MRCHSEQSEESPSIGRCSIHRDPSHSFGMTAAAHLKYNIAIKAENSDCIPKAQKLAKKLNLELVENDNNYSFLLIVTPTHLKLQQIGKNAPGPLIINFLSDKIQQRVKQPAKELLIKAIGKKKNQDLFVLDATAGLGKDSFLMAQSGCNVLMLERSPIIAALLEDALSQALQDPQFQHLQIKIRITDAINFLKNLTDGTDVIYLDPMFPMQSKKAASKKELQYLQALVGEDLDADELLKISLTKARNRVVVKRPKNAQYLNNINPHHEIIGSSVRYDVYLRL